MGQPSKQKLLKRRVGRLGGQKTEVTSDHISSGIAPFSAKLLWEKGVGIQLKLLYKNQN